MSLQQTFKSSMTWLRPHHTRLGGHDEVEADIRSRPLEQTSEADRRSRPSEGGRDEGAATTSKVVEAEPHSCSQLRSQRRHFRRNRS
ncbi:hypothetical protein Tco_0219137 [Tanacetum coccineum]